MRQEDYLSFLRYSLNLDGEVPTCVQNINWHDLLRFAKKHAIVGVYAYCLLYYYKKLNDCNWNGNKPSEDDVMEWMGEVTKIKHRNILLSRKTEETVQRLKDAGFDCCTLKGQGNGLYYPMPELRTSGDIDVWTWPKKRVASSERKFIAVYIRKQFPNKGLDLCYKDIKYPIYDNIPVEIHFYPSTLNNPFRNRKLLKFFREQRDEQGKHEVTWKCDNESFSFPTPTDAFNRVFQLCHIMHHYFDEGIGLRQLIDYYYLLRRGFTDEERDKDCKILKSFGMYRFGVAVMYIMKEILGLEDKYLLMPSDEKAGSHLLSDILNGGNFGQYNAAFAHDGKQVNPNRFLFKTIHNLSLAKYYPSEALWEPLFRTWHFFWRKLHK